MTCLVSNDVEEQLARGLVQLLSGVVLTEDGMLPQDCIFRQWYNPPVGETDDFWEHQLHEACHVAVSGQLFVFEESALMLEFRVIERFMPHVLERWEQENPKQSPFRLFSFSEETYVKRAQRSWNSKGRYLKEDYLRAKRAFEIVTA